MKKIETHVDEAVTRLEAQLELWGESLNKLLAKGKLAGELAKADSRKHLDALKVRLAEARAKLEEAKAGGAEKWDGFKVGIERTWQDLESTFKKAVA